MRPYLKAIAISSALFILLSLGFGALHSELYEMLPDEGSSGSFSSSALLFVALLPAIVAGYIAGRLSRTFGMAFGAVPIAVGITAIYGLLFSGPSDISQHLVSLVIGSLAGGCGELHANKAAA